MVESTVLYYNNNNSLNLLEKSNHNGEVIFLFSPPSLALPISPIYLPLTPKRGLVVKNENKPNVYIPSNYIG